MDRPDKWVVIKLPDCYKVLATWMGGYLSGDYWRLNSGISSVTEDENYFYFHGFSGSVYQCNKKYYGTSSFSQGISDKIIDEVKGSEILTSDFNFLNLNK